eukprot:UN05991
MFVFVMMNVFTVFQLVCIGYSYHFGFGLCRIHFSSDSSIVKTSLNEGWYCYKRGGRSDHPYERTRNELEIWTDLRKVSPVIINGLYSNDWNDTDYISYDKLFKESKGCKYCKTGKHQDPVSLFEFQLIKRLGKLPDIVEQNRGVYTDFPPEVTVFFQGLFVIMKPT